MGRNKNRKLEVPLRSKLKKDPGVPRLPSLKVRNVEKRMTRPHPGPHTTDPDAEMAEEPTLSSLAATSGNSTPTESKFSTGPSSSSGPVKTREQLRKHYIRSLHKVIDESDIVLMVLDARDPEGCRSRLVEEEVRRRESDGKRLIFVLNKIDLIPKENAQAWLRHLRHTTPTLPFRSATQHQRTKLSSSTAPALVRLLKAYRPNPAQSMTVGVVGYPNVGKSSLINSLKRSKVCAVAAQPGHTKELQSVQLERGLRILDSPGVVFDDDDFDASKSKSRSNVLLRNVIKVEDIDDPISLVEEIVARTDPELLKKIYNLPQIGSTLEFLTMLALTTGRLMKGGTPDLLAASRIVLTDWNHQKIPYYTVPPTVHPSLIPSTVKAGGELTVAPGAENVGQAQIVSEYSKPFSLEGLFGAADAGAFGEASGPDAMELEREEEVVDEMDEDGKRMESDDLAPIIPRKRSRSASSGDLETEAIPQPVPESNLRPPPKRLRRSHEVPDYNSPVDEHTRRTMASANPLSRHVLRKEAKKARRAATRAMNAQKAGAGGMEVDDDGGLATSFMAGVAG
ncbi:P-loop containing nucleoside triphosphate hydrolase protein [Laetiporus sulphureus 93-53]|uniref:p-loop containing nucleoside triphosphate hydrolase protein n=1 Tax=Laetiporus sulphureus 93-53 TaxID=1314785 RepID=A0A165CMH7_9APHY|nr:P-loop containing nucleoside triphosphate hydrolase protein [Laetiporus sulphureus 93-53]KZT03079.1 P-loop containing nucleoside triphosphate hydrolase protein [Laetiporus sulphureus 93-53]